MKEEDLHKDIEIETYEKPEINVDFLRRKSHTKTYRGHLIGNIQKCRNDNNDELEKVFEDELRVYDKFNPPKIEKITIVEGWEKGNGEFLIEKDVDNDFVVEIWHKENKEKKDC